MNLFFNVSRYREGRVRRMDRHATKTTQSQMSRVYHALYESLAGHGANPRLWHFQWLAVYALHADLQARLASIRGQLLDVGCGQKPYTAFLQHSVKHLGIDIAPGPGVDLVMDGQSIPLPDASVDAVLCTQVMEHVRHPELVRAEMVRCLKPGGLLIVTVPFIYNEHGVPSDFWRFSQYGIAHLFHQEIDITEVVAEGGIGSSLGLLFLNWIDIQTSRYLLTRVLKGVLLPLHLCLALFINILGWLGDRLDQTGAFYNNLLLVGTKRREPRCD